MANYQTKTLDKKIHNRITEFYHKQGIARKPPKKLFALIKKAYQINLSDMPFYHEDFEYLGISYSNFRRIVSDHKGLILVHMKSSNCSYKLAGMKLTGDSKKFTIRPMGGEGIYKMLVDVKIKLNHLTRMKNQPVTIHDIRYQFKNDTLHAALKNKGYAASTSNNLIRLDYPISKEYVTVKILIYPKTIQVIIGCTYRPIIYDSYSAYGQLAMLGEIMGYLKAISEINNMTPVTEWIFNGGHFAKDSPIEYNGKSIHEKVDDMINGFIRFYSKEYPDKNVRPRLEYGLSPKIKVEQMVDDMIYQTEQSEDSLLSQIEYNEKRSQEEENIQNAIKWEKGVDEWLQNESVKKESSDYLNYLERKKIFQNTHNLEIS